MKLRYRFRLPLVIGLVGLAFGLTAVPVRAGAYPTTGTIMANVHFATQCAYGVSVGVAFDGTNLWYTCYNQSTDLRRADAHTGADTAVYSIAGGLGAIAYDSARNALWAGPGGPNPGAIWLIKLDASHNVASSAIQFNAGADADALVDGMAYDGTDDTLYFEPDSSLIHHYQSNGTKINDITGAASCSGNVTSGLAVGGNLLFEAKDLCNHVYVVDKHAPYAPAFDFSTVVSTDRNLRGAGLTCDTVTFAPVDVVWSKESYYPNRAVAFAIPKGTCGVGGQPAPPVDQSISAQGVSFTASEGGQHSGVTATFSDPDTAGLASDYSASIDWGDGSPAGAGTISGSAGSFSVAGSHTYVEEGRYSVKVTITDTDTAGNTASATSIANVGDASLVASRACPRFSVQPFNSATATFTDAASPSGTPSDFSASVNWGDGTTSAGTVTGAAGGPYTVSGSHAYAATGIYIMTTTITDAGGSTASASCPTFAFVFNFPPGWGPVPIA